MYIFESKEPKKLYFFNFKIVNNNEHADISSPLLLHSSNGLLISTCMLLQCYTVVMSNSYPSLQQYYCSDTLPTTGHLLIAIVSYFPLL
jgi:hypothetical protein